MHLCLRPSESVNSPVSVAAVAHVLLAMIDLVTSQDTYFLAQGDERKDWRKVRQMTMVRPDTPLTDVLKLLLDAGVSAVPVVDDKVRLAIMGNDWD